MLKSLHLKIMLILLLLVVTVMAVVGTYLLNSVGTYYENAFYTEMGEVLTADFLDELRSRLDEGESDGAVDYVLAYSARLGLNDSRRFWLLDGATAEPLGGSSDAAVTRTANVIAALAGKVGMSKQVGTDYFDIAVPVESAGGSCILYIRDSRDSASALQKMLFTATLQSLLIGLTIALLLSFLLSKTISRPLELLTRSAARLADGDFTSKPPVNSNDEIGVLTGTFNRMSQALEDTLGEVENERNKLSAVFQHMTDGVVALDLAGAVLHINSAARRSLGLPEGDQTPGFADIFGPAGITLAELEAPGAAGGERICRIGERDLKFFFAPFGTGEHEGGIIVVIYDITEQKKLDTSRREFVADVSHELRTPLTNVYSYAETILADDEMPPAVRKRFLQVIINETDRMTRLVKDLLTISRLDYGRTDWKITVFSPSELVANIVEAMRIEAQKHGQTLELEAEGELPTVAADKNRLEQVYANIIGNAIKYTPSGGRIVVRAAEEGGAAVVRVIDNGIGIPPADLPHIFERFYRVEKARSRDAGGSGLGLAIAKEFITYMHGTIEIASASGGGTTVVIKLPQAAGTGTEK